MRTCSKCLAVKPETSEFFQPQKRCRLGLRPDCKECCRKKVVDWQKANKERFNARLRLWKLINKDRASEHRRAYRIKNKLKIQVDTLNRIAKKKAAPGKYTVAQIRDLLAKQRNKCAACRVDISTRRHIDHVVPLIAGGSNDISNIQLLCPTCNLSKGKRSNHEFMRSKGLLI